MRMLESFEPLGEDDVRTLRVRPYAMRVAVHRGAPLRAGRSMTVSLPPLRASGIITDLLLHL